MVYYFVPQSGCHEVGTRSGAQKTIVLLAQTTPASSWLAAAPLPAAHSYGLQPQGAGNSSLTAWVRSVSPIPPSPPAPPSPVLCDQPSNGFCCYMQ